MKTENLNKLIEVLENSEWQHEDSEPQNGTSFNMFSQSFNCGSPSCLAGHCAVLLGRDATRGTQRHIKEYLDVNEKTAEHLYYGRYSYNSLNEITVEETVTYLKDIR